MFLCSFAYFDIVDVQIIVLTIQFDTDDCKILPVIFTYQPCLYNEVYFYSYRYLSNINIRWAEDPICDKTLKMIAIYIVLSFDQGLTEIYLSSLYSGVYFCALHFAFLTCDSLLLISNSHSLAGFYSLSRFALHKRTYTRQYSYLL